MKQQMTICAHRSVGREARHGISARRDELNDSFGPPECRRLSGAGSRREKRSTKDSECLEINTAGICSASLTREIPSSRK